MHRLFEPIQVGDLVTYTDLEAESGLVTERICKSYVRVLWSGAAVPRRRLPWPSQR